MKGKSRGEPGYPFLAKAVVWHNLHLVWFSPVRAHPCGSLWLTFRGFPHAGKNDVCVLCGVSHFGSCFTGKPNGEPPMLGVHSVMLNESGQVELSDSGQAIYPSNLPSLSPPGGASSASAWSTCRRPARPGSLRPLQRDTCWLRHGVSRVRPLA